MQSYDTVSYTQGLAAPAFSRDATASTSSVALPFAAAPARPAVAGFQGYAPYSGLPLGGTAPPPALDVSSTTTSLLQQPSSSASALSRSSQPSAPTPLSTAWHSPPLEPRAPRESSTAAATTASTVDFTSPTFASTLSSLRPPSSSPHSPASVYTPYRDHVARTALFPAPKASLSFPQHQQHTETSTTPSTTGLLSASASASRPPPSFSSSFSAVPPTSTAMFMPQPWVMSTAATGGEAGSGAFMPPQRTPNPMPQTAPVNSQPPVKENRKRKSKKRPRVHGGVGDDNCNDDNCNDDDFNDDFFDDETSWLPKRTAKSSVAAAAALITSMKDDTALSSQQLVLNLLKTGIVRRSSVLRFKESMGYVTGTGMIVARESRNMFVTLESWLESEGHEGRLWPTAKCGRRTFKTLEAELKLLRRRAMKAVDETKWKALRQEKIAQPVLQTAGMCVRFGIGPTLGVTNVCSSRGWGTVRPDTFVEACFNCGSSGSAREPFVRCRLCCEPYHTYCVDLPAKDARKPGVHDAVDAPGSLPALISDFRCLNCLVCEQCSLAEPESELLVCDDCERGYHCRCLERPLDSVPDGTWRCDLCVQCQVCGTRDPGPRLSDRWQLDYTHCQSCADSRRKGNVCPGCDGVYSDDDWDIRMLQCDGCDRWVHQACAQLSDEQYDAIQINDNSLFFCESCGLAHDRQQFNALRDANDHVRECFDADNTDDAFLGWSQEALLSDRIALHASLARVLERLCESPSSTVLFGRQQRETYEQGEPLMVDRPVSESVESMEAEVSQGDVEKQVGLAEKAQGPRDDGSVANEPAVDAESCGVVELTHVRVVLVEPEQDLPDSRWILSEIVHRVTHGAYGSVADFVADVRVLFRTIVGEAFDSPVCLEACNDAHRCFAIELTREFGEDIVRACGCEVFVAPAAEVAEAVHTDDVDGDDDRATDDDDNNECDGPLVLAVSVAHHVAALVSSGKSSRNKRHRSSLSSGSKKRGSKAKKAAAATAAAAAAATTATTAAPDPSPASSMVEGTTNAEDGTRLAVAGVEDAEPITRATPVTPVVVVSVEEEEEEERDQLAMESYPTPGDSLVSSTSPDATTTTVVAAAAAADEEGDTSEAADVVEAEAATAATGDTRMCALCGAVGDKALKGMGRLVVAQHGEWVHMACVWWSSEVCEQGDGALVNSAKAIRRSRTQACTECTAFGATIGCCEGKCLAMVHLPCAKRNGYTFHADKRVFCAEHAALGEGLPRFSLDTRRHVFYVDSSFVNRSRLAPGADAPELERVELVHGALTVLSMGVVTARLGYHTSEYLYPIGFCSRRFFWSTVRLNIIVSYVCRVCEGEDGPRFELQCEADGLFETADTPGELWKLLDERVRTLNKGDDEEDDIDEEEEGDGGERDNDSTTTAMTTAAAAARTASGAAAAGTVVKPKNAHKALPLVSMDGHSLFGLSMYTVVELLESQPDAAECVGYVFRVRQRPPGTPSQRAIELSKPMELEHNASGCARGEVYTRRRPHDMFDFLHGLQSQRSVRNASAMRRNASQSMDSGAGSVGGSADDGGAGAGGGVGGVGNGGGGGGSRVSGGGSSGMGGSLAGGGGALPSSMSEGTTVAMGDCQQLPMSMQYRMMRAHSKAVAKRSGIHGMGLFCIEPYEAHEMIIEYVGTLVRNPVADAREKDYFSRGIGTYLFRIEDELVIDATVAGNAARFINHSCDPNCYSKIVTVEGRKKVIIFALRNVHRGEELVYDYKMAEEPAEDKITCCCAAHNCRGTMN